MKWTVWPWLPRPLLCEAFKPEFPSSDIINGLRFSATMSMSTPLRVLFRHGEIFRGLPDHPPQIARSMSEGIWMPELKTYREMGVDIDESPGMMASSIGPIALDGGNYLKFLIAVREIVETANPINERLARLVAEVGRPCWASLSGHRHHNATDVDDLFFPQFLHTIPKLSMRSIATLVSMKLDTPAALDAADDATLLAVPGVGPRILAEIRASCSAATSDRDDTRADAVAR